MACTVPPALRVALYTNPAPEPLPLCIATLTGAVAERYVLRDSAAGDVRASHKNLQGKSVYEWCECLGSLPPFFKK